MPSPGSSPRGACTWWLAGRSESAVDAAVAMLMKDGVSVSGHALDITDPASVVRVFADAGNQFGRLDVLVNNAGIAIDRGPTRSAA